MDINELHGIIANIRCSVGANHWTIHCGVMGDGFYIQLRYLEPDIETQDPTDQHGRKWYVSSHSVKSEVVQTVLKAALTSAEHQVREHFTFCGERVFSPHFDVDTILGMLREGTLGKSYRAPRPDPIVIADLTLDEEAPAK